MEKENLSYDYLMQMVKKYESSAQSFQRSAVEFQKAADRLNRTLSLIKDMSPSYDKIVDQTRQLAEQAQQHATRYAELVKEHTNLAIRFAEMAKKL